MLALAGNAQPVRRSGGFSSLYGTTFAPSNLAFRSRPAARGLNAPVLDRDGQLIVGLNDWYRLLRCTN
jgi:hypothetical protein